jgi:hypothetical protein
MSSLMTFFFIFKATYQHSVFILLTCIAMSFTRAGLRSFSIVRGKGATRLSALLCLASFGLGLSRFRFFIGLRCCR